MLARPYGLALSTRRPRRRVGAPQAWGGRAVGVEPEGRSPKTCGLENLSTKRFELELRILKVEAPTQRLSLQWVARSSRGVVTHPDSLRVPPFRPSILGSQNTALPLQNLGGPEWGD